MLQASRIPHETKLFERKAGLAPGLAPPFYMTRRLSRWLQRSRTNLDCRNQAATFLRVRFVGAGSGASGAFGLRPSPIVLANVERAAA